MKHPFQSLKTCQQKSGSWVLLLACGAHLTAVDTENGSTVASWQAGEGDQNAKASITHICHSRSASPPFIALITDTSKSVIVLQLHADGFHHVQTHPMLKRPCALSFTPDDKFLLSGDKFGDVYAIPMDPKTKPEAAFGGSVLGKRKRTDRNFAKPTATDLTVHTRKNRRALESQLKQAEKAARSRNERNEDGKDGKQDQERAAADEPDERTQRPILGHVSMLLDLLAVRMLLPMAASADGSKERRCRDYILTSDRDEHIRVSRGIPQAYVIETFCLGHTSFVNTMCIVQRNLLVSGGGDKFLFVWDWVQGRLLRKIDIEILVQKARENLGPRDIVVVGLWKLPSTARDESDEEFIDFLCAIEALPGLFRFTSSTPLPLPPFDQTELDFNHEYIPLRSNVQDVNVLNGRIDISMDTIHEPGSSSEYRNATDSNAQSTSTSPNSPSSSFNPYSRLKRFSYASPSHPKTDQGSAVSSLEEVPLSEDFRSSVDALGPEVGDRDAKGTKKLEGFLYGLENLRKRGNDDS